MKYIQHLDLPKDVDRRKLGWKVLQLVGRTKRVVDPKKAAPKRGRIASSFGCLPTGYSSLYPRHEYTPKVEWTATTFWRIGKWVRAKSERGYFLPQVCLYGLHCSPSIPAALSYVRSGQVLALVEYRGQSDVQKGSGTVQTKRASEEMRILHAWVMTPEFKSAAQMKWAETSWNWSYLNKRIPVTPQMDLHQMVSQLQHLGGIK